MINKIDKMIELADKIAVDVRKLKYVSYPQYEQTAENACMDCEDLAVLLEEEF